MTELPAQSTELTDSSAWKALEAHLQQMSAIHLRTLLAEPGRYGRLSRETDQFVLDFSRQRVTATTMDLLLRLARERKVEQWIDALFSGASVNCTENRPALHMALRSQTDAPIWVDGQNVMPLVQQERRRMLEFAAAVRSGDYTGHTGSRITDVVNIGIGGSDLGLVMANTALHRFRDKAIQTHFVSNIDGTQLADVLQQINPETTLFIICSKSFTTLETRLNAESARAWLLAHLPEGAVGRHFVAISVNDAAMDAFGIDQDNRFMIWDWVGGRYSLWSAVGLVIAIGVGPDHFQALLAGAAEVDEHFRKTRLEDNLPVIMGLLGVWNQNFLGMTSHAVLPYDHRLSRFPAFLQQLAMESLGKSVTRDGRAVKCSTGTVIWGEAGSNAQHSFFQLLHQGTVQFSVDFIAPVQASSEYADQHQQGLANMLAQAETFAHGQPADEVDAHRVYPGNHPSNILVFERLDPHALGCLVALYEHRVFVQSVIWGINPFDQWGVELGKAIAADMHKALMVDGGPSGIGEKIKGWL